MNGEKNNSKTKGLHSSHFICLVVVVDANKKGKKESRFISIINFASVVAIIAGI